MRLLDLLKMMRKTVTFFFITEIFRQRSSASSIIEDSPTWASKFFCGGNLVRYHEAAIPDLIHLPILISIGNPHDGNAIRIDNVGGQQIGYCPRTMAAKIAKYIDNRWLLMEGQLAGTIGTYDCPLVIHSEPWCIEIVRSVFADLFVFVYSVWTGSKLHRRP